MDLSKRAEQVNREVRQWTISDVEVRRADDGTANFRGIASVTEKPYEVHDAFGTFSETIDAGAFKRTLTRNPDVVFLANHGGLTMARTTAGTLRLSAPNGDLAVDADLDTRRSDVADAALALERRDVDQMSFAFRVPSGGQEWNDDYTERRILEVDIHRGDVSVVNFGANPHTTAELLRSLGGCGVAEFEEAFAAVQNGTADEGQMAVVERAHQSMSAALTKPAEDPDAYRRQMILNRNRLLLAG